MNRQYPWTALAALLGLAAGLLGGCGSDSNEQPVAQVHRGCTSDAPLSQCVSACEAGHGASCTQAANDYHLGLTEPRNDPRAADLFDRACTLGHSAGCGGLGRAFLNGYGRPRDDRRAVALLKRACETVGNVAAEPEPARGEACGYLGLLQRDGRGGLLPDTQAALDLWSRACEAGHAGSCRLAGEVVGRGAPAARLLPAPDRSLTLLSKACRGGDRPACGRVFEIAMDPAFATKKAVLLREACVGDSAGACSALAALKPEDRDALLARACALGDGAACRQQTTAGVDGVDPLFAACERNDAPGCFLLAERYGPDGPSPDAEKARTLLTRACSLGSGIGCAGLAGVSSGADAATANQTACELGEIPACMVAATSEHLPVSLRARLTQRACSAGLAAGCTAHGKSLEFGRGHTTNFEAAFEAYRKGCEGGDPAGCVRQGVLLDLGQGVQKSRTRATRLFETGCENGAGAGCTYLGALAVYDGDPDRGRRLLKKGCKLGHTVGCQQLKRLERAM